MNKRILEIFLKRLNILPVYRKSDEALAITKKEQIIFSAELFTLWYNLDNISYLNKNSLVHFNDVIKILTEMKGGNVKYIPLFSKFPDDIPDDDEFLAARILGFIHTILGDENESDIQLENGIVLPNFLFDLEEYGADPVTLNQVQSLFDKWVKNQEKRKSDSNFVIHNITVMQYDDAIEKLVEYVQNIFASKTSIPEYLKEDIEYLLNELVIEKESKISLIDVIDINTIVHKEIASYISNFLWNNINFKWEWFEDSINRPKLKELLKTPTDILRLFASLTDSDISLSEKIRFPKLSRPQRRFIMDILVNNINVDDILQYKGLWKSLAKTLHVSEYSNKLKYNDVVYMLNQLRNNTNDLTSYNSDVEFLIKQKDLNKLLEKLSERPWIFARKLHEVLIIAEKEKNLEVANVSFNRITDVLNAFQKISHNVQLKNLLVMETYFATIEDQTKRTIVNKKGHIKIIDKDTNILSNDTIIRTVSMLKDIINTQISNKKDNAFFSKSNFYINPDLKNYVLPLSLRKSAEWILSLGRGSQIDISKEKSNIIRLFTYWKESKITTDLDLSALMYDEDFNYISHVSYTNLSEWKIVHSWDITSAPYWAAEFIDLDLNFFKKENKNIKYVVPQLLKYDGENFAETEMTYMGWMMRDDVNSDVKSFDIKTVVNKMNVTGNGKYYIPFLLDVVNNKIIYVDLYVNWEDNYNNVEWSNQNTSIIMKEVIQMKDTKPNFYDLFEYYINANGSKIITKEEFDEIISDESKHNVYDLDINDVNYWPFNANKVLSELL